MAADAAAGTTHCAPENVQEQQCVRGNRGNAAETGSGLPFSFDLGTMGGGICSDFLKAIIRTGHRRGPGTQGYVAELDSAPSPIFACV